MVDVRLAHTADLAPDVLAAARALLFAAFDDMADEDWEHALGGMHATAWDGADLVGHASLIQRRLLHDGRALRTGYVEAVAVRADRRRQGVGSALMAPLERMVRAAYDLGALGATDEGAAFYAARGWQRWVGPLFAITPDGVRRTPGEEDCVWVLPGAVPLDLTRDLTCDWRDGDVW